MPDRSKNEPLSVFFDVLRRFGGLGETIAVIALRFCALGITSSTGESRVETLFGIFGRTTRKSLIPKRLDAICLTVE